MSERTDGGTTVDEDGVRVEKSFTDDAFPVPAVRYDLSSDREDAVRVRIVDQIPESFPMDRIGFHPDYESDNWTAYKDHRVEFERVLEPGERVETVFGIRDDDPDLDGFLNAPVIEHVPVGEEIEDVLGAGDTDAVREVLAGDRTTLPGMEETIERESESETIESEPEPPDPESEIAPVDAVESDSEPADAPEPRAVTEENTAVVTPRDTVEDAEADEPETAESVSEEAPPEAETVSDDEAETVSDDEAETVSDEESKPTAGAEGGVAAALAAEIRSGEADPEDVRTITSELDGGVPRSVDVRIGRLQSSVADIEAYADALAEFIDGEGTAREILEELNDKIDAVESTVATLDDRADDAETARTELREDLSRVDEAVDGVTDDVSAVDERVESVETAVDDATTDIDRIDEETDEIAGSVDNLSDDVEALSADLGSVETDLDATDDRVDDVESRLGRFDEEFDDLWDDLAEVDTRLTEVEDRLGDDLDDIEAELDAIDEHLEELEAFRKRLNEAFGP